MAPTTSPSPLRQALADARAQTDSLFDLIAPGALYERPIPERHRMVFYLGHLEAFDWNLLGRALDLPTFHSSFDHLFSFGIDPDSSDLPTDQPPIGPPPAKSATTTPGSANRARCRPDQNVPNDLMHVAIEHRLMHAETFAYMLHHLPFEQKAAPERCHRSIGTATRGAHGGNPRRHGYAGPQRGDGFGWDNEFEYAPN